MTSHCHPQNLTLPPGVKPFRSDNALDLHSAHKIECNDDMVYRNGSKFVRCLPNGTWSNPDLQCAELSCRYRCVRVTSSVNWTKAQDECRSRGASLAEVNSQDEWKMIRKATLKGCKNDHVWIGGQNNSWVTSGGSIQVPSNWTIKTQNAVDIDNSCVVINFNNSDGGRLIHSDCNQRNTRVLCEKKTTCF